MAVGASVKLPLLTNYRFAGKNLMTVSMTCVRAVFAILAIAMLGMMTTALAPTQSLGLNLLIGIAAGALLTATLFTVERLLRSKASLRTLNVIALALFIGAITAVAVLVLFNGLLAITSVALGSTATVIIQAIIYLTTTFFALILTAQAADELHLVIPFIHFKPTASKKRDLLLDASALQDPRLIDLAASGLLDEQTVLPRFIVHELHELNNNSEDESIRNKVRNSLEIVSKLESLPYLNLRYTEVDFADVKDPITRLTRLARHLDANILTADINRVQQSAIEGVRIINIHSLSNALKPLMQKGEIMSIKIQRPGKDPQQGIGYLDDGTMVVINGGANYMSKTIQAQVLGVKHTSSGRMIFCNAIEDGEYTHRESSVFQTNDRDTSSRRYFMD
jgi:uncharacterized protein YacL